MIYAIDFDGTICSSAWPGIGDPIPEAVWAIRELKRLGHTIILWTCRGGEKLEAALRWLDMLGVPIDYANENDPAQNELYGNDSRKVGAFRYVDDRNAGRWSWQEIIEEARALTPTCPKCGSTEFDENERCIKCGHYLNDNGTGEVTVKTCPKCGGVMSKGVYQWRCSACKHEEDTEETARERAHRQNVGRAAMEGMKEGLRKAGLIAGVGPDAPTVVNEHGGKQSDSPYRIDLIPPQALLSVAAVFKKGAAKYGDHNWRKITITELLNHSIVHALAYLAGDESDEHLEHFATRGIMALAQKIAPTEDTPQ